MTSTYNPMLKTEKFKETATRADRTRQMNFRGISDKALLLLGILLVAGGWAWRVYSVQGVQRLTLYLIAGIVACIGLSIYIFRNTDKAKIFGLILAVFEGFTLGSISAVFEVEFSGIVIQAMAAYMGVMLIMLMLHKFSSLRIVANASSIAIFSFFGIVVAYLSTWLISLIGVKVIFLHETGIAGILISLLIIAIATTNIILDFLFLEGRIKESTADKHEWYAAVSLMVSLIWLYLEIIRRPAKLK